MITLTSMARRAGLAAFFWCGAAAAENVAVVRLEADAADQSLAAAVAEAVAAALKGAPGMTVVERGQVAKVLQEQALGQTGAVTEASAPELGRLLGAEKLVVGRVSRVGAAWQADVRLVNSASAAVERTGTAQFTLPAQIPLCARQLVAGLTGVGSAAADPVVVRQLAQEMAQTIASELAPIRARLRTADGHMAGFAAPAGRRVFPDRTFANHGNPEFNTEGEAQSFCLTKSVSAGAITVACTADATEGDELRSTPLSVTVHGPVAELNEALQASLMGREGFAAAGTRNTTAITLDISLGTGATGQRRISATVVNAKGASIMALNPLETL